MKSILMPILFMFAIACQAQLKPDNYAVFKKNCLFKEIEGYDEKTYQQHNVLIEDRLYIVNSLVNNKVVLSAPVSGILFQADSSDIYWVDKMEKEQQRKVVSQYLRQVSKAYAKKGRFSYEGDSIYENYYSPIRNQLVKSWIFDQDAPLMSKWFKFLKKNNTGDDALDAKYLSICFLKRPKEFTEELKKEKKLITDYISNLMLSSSGFMLATGELKMDYEKSVFDFKRLMHSSL